MDLWAFIAILFYFILHLIFYLGLKRSLCTKRVVPDGRLPFISVIIAARNEESNIGKCIESLDKISYPNDSYEIILVNDSSTDRTQEIMHELTKECKEFIILNTSDATDSNLTGKTRALAYGLELSKGELIMMTDADCTVPESWLSDTAAYYNNNTGMICGFTKINHDKGFFPKLQALDWLYLQSLASASSGINSELSCIGNNLSVSRKALDFIGGYEGLKFSVTEDLALLRKIKSSGKFSIKYPVDKRTLARTQPCANLKELYRQKKRWFRGGTGINWLGYILGVLMYAVNIILVSGPFYLNPLVYLEFLFLKFLSDLIIMVPVYKIHGYKGLLRYFPLFQLYFAVYGLLLPFTFLIGYKIVWKDRSH